ncbi:MAG: MBL fold metallo-hydrolase [Gammaproteobacteria bacterium]|nr:MBL fold metallo-hydrolase [Gammaproteobacteria bacterium]
MLEFEWPEREPEFLLTGVTREDISGTRTGNDARFVDPATHLLLMSFHSLVVRTRAGVLLVDTCVGNHKDRPMLPEWHQQEWPYLERLAQAGLTPADIDYVCCTHLHGDHVGWNTMLDNGRWVPTFPNARYLFALDELSYWESHHREDPDSIYRRPWEDSVLPVIEAGQAQLVEMDHAVDDELWLEPTPGHTPGHVSVRIASQGEEALITGDVMHHPCQMARPDWTSTPDVNPEQACATRRALLESVADTPVLVTGTHFATPTAGHVRRDGDVFRLDV